jgi:hypothetical protein
MHSPSRLFIAAGINIAESTGQGVREGAPRLNRAVADMVTTRPSAPPPVAQSITNNTQRDLNLTLVIPMPGGDIRHTVKLTLESLLDGAMVNIGATPGLANG